jgi:hypothetical protein
MQAGAHEQMGTCQHKCINTDASKYIRMSEHRYKSVHVMRRRILANEEDTYM